MTEKNGVERSTATEILRRMLDEHDEYYKTSGNKTLWGRPIDRQTGKPINVFHYQAQPMGEDRLFVELQLATPEQAIAATLGATDARPTQAESSGTCRIKPWKVERGTGFFDCMECSECGYVTDVSDWAKWHFCPNCGRRIEQ